MVGIDRSHLYRRMRALGIPAARSTRFLAIAVGNEPSSKVNEYKLYIATP